MFRHSTTFSALSAMREDISRPLAWKKWKKDLLDICSVTNGLLALLYTEEECEQLFGMTVYIPLDPGDAATIDPAALYNHKKRADKFEQFERDAKELRGVFLQLPADLLQPLHKDGSLRKCTVKKMFTRIDQKLSSLVPADYEAIEKRLSEMWDPSVDTEAFLSKKVELFEDLDTAGQPKPMLDKVNIIIKCLPTHLFQRCVESFYEKYESVAKQTVVRLCKHVIKYATNVLLRARREGAMLAVGKNPLEGLSEDAIDRLAVALEARLGPRMPAGETKMRKYCWTHGPCNHLSKDCTTPRLGHQPDATADKKMGGAVVFTSARRGEKRKSA